MRRTRCVVAASVAAALMPVLLGHAQTAPEVKGRVSAPVHVDGWGRTVADKPKDYKPGPAPVRDLSGIWEPADGWRAGVQATGARDNPSDRNHTLPYTPLGVRQGTLSVAEAVRVRAADQFFDVNTELFTGNEYPHSLSLEPLNAVGATEQGPRVLDHRTLEPWIGEAITYFSDKHKTVPFARPGDWYFQLVA